MQCRPEQARLQAARDDFREPEGQFQMAKEKLPSEKFGTESWTKKHQGEKYQVETDGASRLFLLNNQAGQRSGGHHFVPENNSEPRCSACAARHSPSLSSCW
jgi:hypothetical protein